MVIHVTALKKMKSLMQKADLLMKYNYVHYRDK